MTYIRIAHNLTIAILQPLLCHGWANSAYSALVNVSCAILNKRSALSYAVYSCFELSADLNHMAEVVGSSPIPPIPINL